MNHPPPPPAPTGAPIWPADWSQFIPDVLSGLLVSVPVGIVVGIMLWRWQRNSESRQAKAAAESGWKVARASVAKSFSAPMTRQEDYWIFNYAAQTDDLVEDAERFPIGEWADASPDNQELALMRQLLIDAPTLRRLASELNNWIESESVRFGLAREGRTTDIAGAATRSILGVEPDPNSSHIFFISADQRAGLERILDGDTTKAKIREFLEVAKRVEKAYEAMRSKFFGAEQAASDT